jgi:hypothetical protein
MWVTREESRFDNSAPGLDEPLSNARRNYRHGRFTNEAVERRRIARAAQHRPSAPAEAPDERPMVLSRSLVR